MRKGNLKQQMKGTLTEAERRLLKRAFDVVGDIAILEIPDGLQKKERKIARAVMAMHPNVKTVVKKAGSHTGRLRRQKMQHLAGERKTETMAVENGVRLKLDVTRVYYSPRQATERQRIISQVRKGEDVLVMFSGAGPYVIEIAKHTRANVVGVELNKAGHAYAMENAKLNKADAALYCGDVRKVVPALRKKFDRIVMPLPKAAEKYLDVAFAAARKGATIHFYGYEKEEDIPKAAVEKVKNAAAAAKKKVRILRTVRCGQLGVRQYRVCVDFRVG